MYRPKSRPLATIAVSLVLAACGASPAADPDWQIVPGTCAGAILPHSTEADLRQAYGTAAVHTTRVELGEGETAPGTVLFAADSVRRLEVLWRDTIGRQHPVRLVLRGGVSRWRLPGGVTLGTTLHDLEQLNGRAFTLAGFGWDYGGAVVDWAGGALSARLPGVHLYLTPPAEQRRSAVYRQVLGDRDYASSTPAMQALNPRIFQVFVDFE